MESDWNLDGLPIDLKGGYRIDAYRNGIGLRIRLGEVLC
jgi:hypothetical protein